MAEDDASNQLVIRSFLKKLGHNVDCVNNGEEAVTARTQHRYDLILMDYEMPKMSGLQATKAIRDWEEKNKHRPLPIIALTAHAMEEQHQKCLNA
ncbi:MAG: response regulator [Pseudomonadales bacterium]|nr:response regulator [Pseudomonadales bacterium]